MSEWQSERTKQIVARAREAMQYGPIVEIPNRIMEVLDSALLDIREEVRRERSDPSPTPESPQ